MREEKAYFKSSDNLTLCGILTLAEQKTDKCIILCHGITVDKDEDGIFSGLAAKLALNGFNVFRFDFRGHGESEGNSVDMTIKGETEDLETALKFIESKGFEKIGLVGASFGGGVTALYTSKHQDSIKCLCLWNPCLNYDHIFLNPYLPWLVDRIDEMKSDLKTKKWATLGSRNFKVGKRLFDEMEKIIPYEALRQITIPTIIIHGDKDTDVPYEDSVEYSKLVKNGSLIIIKGAEHGFHDRKEDAEQADQATVDFFLQNLK